MRNRIGIVGGGQLGRMLTFEAKKVGFTVTVLDPTPGSPAGQVADSQITGPYSDPLSTRMLADASDYLTVEIEHISTETLSELSQKGVVINPLPETIAMIKNKFAQKEFLTKAGIPVAAYTAVENREDIIQAAGNFGYPFLLKTRFDAYDGRGNAVIHDPSEIDTALVRFANRPLYVEKFVPFVKELAIMMARSMKGEIVSYPVVETVHANNILQTVFAPARIEEHVHMLAEKLARQTMKRLLGAGVFGIEMFLTKDKQILINEIAPRVHNSGHYTIEACVTSQFEQHIRAISGLPLGNPQMLVPAAVMINILGDRKGKAQVTGLDKALALENVSVHIYGKKETLPERKMGHVTVIGQDTQQVYKTAMKARAILSI